MPHPFPSPEWLTALEQKLNTDEKYAAIAKNWEGDILFIVEPDDKLDEPLIFYIDLWHGKCRQAYLVNGEQPGAAFQLRAPFTNWERILQGKIQPMQAMFTQKLKVKGNMAYLMRHVPTVLDFTRCAQEITTIE